VDPVADADSVETKEWVDALQAVVREGGPQRGLYLVNELEEQLRRQGIRSSVQPYSAYLNTIPLNRQGPYPGDLALEEKITSIIRWNALAMVVRANQAR
jgi:pyruvate dehydrogenase E1 component